MYAGDAGDVEELEGTGTADGLDQTIEDLPAGEGSYSPRARTPTRDISHGACPECGGPLFVGKCLSSSLHSR